MRPLGGRFIEMIGLRIKLCRKALYVFARRRVQSFVSLARSRLLAWRVRGVTCGGASLAQAEQASVVQRIVRHLALLTEVTGAAPGSGAAPGDPPCSRMNRRKTAAEWDGEW